MASSAIAGTHIQSGDTASGALGGTYPNPSVSFSTSPAGSTTQVQFNNAGVFAGSADVKIHSGNALLNLSDASNPYSFADGYGIKMTISGHLGAPVTLYGMNFSLGGSIAGDTYGYYANVDNASSANNYGAFLSAKSGSGNYGLWVDAGQVLIKSSMTVTGAGGMSNTYGVTVGSITINSGGSAGQALCWKTNTTLSYCDSVVGVSGGCTCH